MIAPCPPTKRTLQWVLSSNSHQFSFFTHRLSRTAWTYRFKFLCPSRQTSWHQKKVTVKNDFGKQELQFFLYFFFKWEVFQLRDEFFFYFFFSKGEQKSQKTHASCGHSPGRIRHVLRRRAGTWTWASTFQPRFPITAKAMHHSSPEWLLYSPSDSNPVLNPSIMRIFLNSSSFIGQHLHFQCHCN